MSGIFIVKCVKKMKYKIVKEEIVRFMRGKYVLNEICSRYTKILKNFINYNFVL